MPEETHAGVRGDAAGAGEDLERNGVAVDFNYLRKRRDVARDDLRKFVVLHSFGAERDDAARTVVDAVVDFMHWL